VRLTPLSAYERETIIVFNDAEDLATITTHQRRILTKLERNPAAEKLEDLPHGRQPGARYSVPAQLISIRSKNRPATKGTPSRCKGPESTRASAANEAQTGSYVTSWNGLAAMSGFSPGSPGAADLEKASERLGAITASLAHCAHGVQAECAGS
jgi:hypothetical protein